MFFSKPATIIAGTLAERCQMNAYLYISMLLTGFGKYRRITRVAVCLSIRRLMCCGEDLN